MEAQSEEKVAKMQQEEDELLEEFGDLLVVMEEPELHSDIAPVEFFYLWDFKLPIFNLFKIVRLYLRDGMLDPTLILALCAKRNIDIEEALADLPLILSGYMSVLYPPVKANKSESKNVQSERNSLYDTSAG